MANRLKCQILLPPCLDDDVIKRHITISIDGTQISSQDYDPKTPSVETVCPQDALLLVELFDIDDAGNKSPLSRTEVTVKDTISPPKPGEVEVRVTSEE